MIRGPTTRAGPWRRADYRLLVGSVAVSAIGDWASGIAVTIWVATSSASPGWVAALVVTKLVPYVLFGTVGGVIADRSDRRRLLVRLDVARALVMAPLMLLVLVDGPIVLAMVLVAVSSGCSAVARPAVIALTPQVVTDDELPAANAIESVVNQLAVFLGPAIAALVVAISSPAAAVLLNAASFAASASMVGRVRLDPRMESAPPSVADEATEAVDGAEPAERAWHQAVAGWRATVAVPGLLAYTVVMVASLFVYGGEDVLKVVVASERLGGAADGLAVMAAAMGVGGLLVAPFAGWCAAHPRVTLVYALSVVATGIPVALLALPRSVPPALVIVGVEGMALIVFEVTAITVLQRSVGNELLGRVAGFQDSLSTAAMLLGGIVVPGLLDRYGLDAVLVGFGGGLTLLTFLAMPALRRLDHFDANPDLVVATTRAIRDLDAPGVDQLEPRGIIAVTQAASAA